MREIPLTQGMVALVDDDDYAWLSAYKWHVLKCPKNKDRVYAQHNLRVGRNKQIKVLMHRVVLGLPNGRVPEVDHIDKNTLNNTKTNLRACSSAENKETMRGHGKLGIKGVYQVGSRYQAVRCRNYVIKRSGLFDSIAEAAAAREAL